MKYKALLGLGALLVAGNAALYAATGSHTKAPVEPPKVEQKVVVPTPPVVTKKPVLRKNKKVKKHGRIVHNRVR